MSGHQEERLHRRGGPGLLPPPGEEEAVLVLRGNVRPAGRPPHGRRRVKIDEVVYGGVEHVRPYKGPNTRVRYTSLGPSMEQLLGGGQEGHEQPGQRLDGEEEGRRGRFAG